MKTTVLLLTSILVTSGLADRHGLIILHGLGGDGPGLGLLCESIRSMLDLGDSVRVFCPTAGEHPHSLLDRFREYIPLLPFGSVPSWFDFKKMPEDAVQSSRESSKWQELESAGSFVDGEIEYMINELGIPSENIVVCGASQGGALTLYEAVHTKYKLGGFMGFVTWYPNLRWDPPTEYNPVNRHTPILHLNGEEDPIIGYAGDTSAAVLRRVFSSYTLDYAHGTHITLLLPPNLPAWYIMIEWIGDNYLLGKYPGWNPLIPDVSDVLDIVEDPVGIFCGFLGC